MTSTILRSTQHAPHRTLEWLHEQGIWQGVTLFTLFSLLLAFVQFGTNALVGTDGYYHSKMGYLIRTQGLTPAFPWLPDTILNQAAFYDHHLLYHAYLALFATTDPAVDGGAALTMGAKIASIVMPALAFTAVYYLLRAQRVPGTAVWTLALFAISEPFLYRMSMPRAQSMSLLLLVLAVHWLLQERYRLLLPLGFAYVWAYNAFPLLLVVAAVYVITTLLTERRVAWQALVYPAVGIGLGLLINPYFPQNLTFIWNHLLPKVGESAVRVGNEWRPYQTWTLVENSAGALLALLTGTLALGWHKERIDKRTLFMLGLTVGFGYLLFKSRRFVEYYPLFGLLFAAFAAAPLWQTLVEKRPKLRTALPLFFVLVLIWPIQQTLSATREQIGDSKTADRYAAASLWLREEAQLSDKLFQTDWDDFTRLFFYNDTVVYTVGLDPTFLQLANEPLFEIWVDITQGEIENPSRLISESFGASYVFSDLNHRDFIIVATADPQLEEIYRDEYAVIFAVQNGD